MPRSLGELPWMQLLSSGTACGLWGCPEREERGPTAAVLGAIALGTAVTSKLETFRKGPDVLPLDEESWLFLCGPRCWVDSIC